jgi:hypothetical protein
MRRILQRAVAVRRVADGKARAGVGIDATAVQVGTRLVVAFQLLLEEAAGRIQRGVLVAAVVLLLLAARVVLARHFHADALGQLVDRVEELEAVVVHQEADRGAVRAAAEAVVELLGRRDVEAGRALVVERAARFVFLALALERDARVDHLDDVGAGKQVVDERVGKSGHAAMNSAAGGRGTQQGWRRSVLACAGSVPLPSASLGAAKGRGRTWRTDGSP